MKKTTYQYLLATMVKKAQNLEEQLRLERSSDTSTAVRDLLANNYAKQKYGNIYVVDTADDSEIRLDDFMYELRNLRRRCDESMRNLAEVRFNYNALIEKDNKSHALICEMQEKIKMLENSIVVDEIDDDIEIADELEDNEMTARERMAYHGVSAEDIERACGPA